MNKHTEWTSGRVPRRTLRIALLLLIFVLGTGMLLPADAVSRIRPKKLTIKLSASTVQVGQKVSARVVKAVPSKASKSVSWKTSSSKIAKINQKGSITPLKAGKVKITATSKLNKKVSASAVLTVKAAKTTEKTGVETIDGITIDHDKKTVSFQGKVNGNYLKGEKTMHFSVSRTGTTAQYAMLKAQCPYYAVPNAFYEGLLSIGGKPWSTDRNYLGDGEKIGDSPSKIANKDYSHVNVTLTWPGQETALPLSQILLDDNGNHPDLDMVFTGNQPNQIASHSGCMIGLNSCYYGTISNQANGYSSVGKYHIDAGHFPAADTLVTVTVSLK
ncbi:MAG: YdjY domain-containing protein [Eubacterium sp.]